MVLSGSNNSGVTIVTYGFLTGEVTIILDLNGHSNTGMNVAVIDFTLEQQKLLNKL